MKDNVDKIAWSVKKYERKHLKVYSTVSAVHRLCSIQEFLNLIGPIKHRRHIGCGIAAQKVRTFIICCSHTLRSHFPREDFLKQSAQWRLKQCLVYFMQVKMCIKLNSFQRLYATFINKTGRMNYAYNSLHNCLWANSTQCLASHYGTYHEHEQIAFPSRTPVIIKTFPFNVSLFVHVLHVTNVYFAFNCRITKCNP